MIHLEYGSDLSVEDSVTRWTAEWTPYLGKQGIRPVTQAPTVITYSGRYMSLAAFLLGCVTFPFGILIWLFVKKEQSLTISFEPLEAGSLWVIRGYAINRVRSQFLRSGFAKVA